ncbi:disintegrin and metalloproteinase domain-containing protein 30-like [Phascolarctos cinereus]|uniref:Disintegrin and metalloproteinase domain-containing protein 30-like n=1 Tax=Phascolarctos cinereus TaxID=38626 RepID=A0A6P5L9I2_PHACI|nr:disintegrin and metalloproteinase domain-containing protein 30-like [Phascolarctos cinereus]
MGPEGAIVSHLAGSLLLLGLGTLLLGPGCLALAFGDRPGRGFSSYEVIIPRQLGPRRGDPEVAGRISYVLQVEGRKQVVHLRPKKFLLSRHLRIFSFTGQGAILEDQPYIPDACSYGGYVEGSPDSLATLNTCFGGLRGIVNMNGSLYQMEPLKDSTKFEHVLYRLKKEVRADRTCQAIDEETAPRFADDQNLEISAKFSWTTYLHLKYIESFLVISNGRYQLLGSNMTACIKEGFTLIALADMVFQGLNCRVYLEGIEVWSDQDKINIKDSKEDKIYEDFMKYKEKQLDHRDESDWAHLIVSKEISTKAKVGGICDKGNSASVSSLSQENLSGSNEFLHALGHIVGMKDDEDGCECQGPDRCLMDKNPGDGGFSNCSYTEYFEKIATYGRCMSNVPTLGKRKISVCGDKVVEGDEQCDCGTPKDCEQDKCCEPTCKLKARATCGSGLCCYNCRFRLAGKLCRAKNSECDLEEYCNGTSEHCPEDTYIQDGTLCSHYGYCFNGFCSSRNQQCKNLFGHSSTSGPLACYQEANRGDRFGNCGIITGVYSKCEPDNVLCGRLQCVNIKIVPVMAEHYTVVMNFVSQGNLTCWGTDYHAPMSTMKLSDIGEVKEGTACGEGFLCINKTCTNMNVLNFDCTVDKCTKRGICNNNRNCHCNYGWAPPFCKKYGYGGSIDSGPPPKWERTPWKNAIPLALFLIRCFALAGAGFLSALGKAAAALQHSFRYKNEAVQSRGKEKEETIIAE